MTMASAALCTCVSNMTLASAVCTGVLGTKKPQIFFTDQFFVLEPTYLWQ